MKWNAGEATCVFVGNNLDTLPPLTLSEIAVVQTFRRGWILDGLDTGSNTWERSHTGTGLSVRPCWRFPSFLRSDTPIPDSLDTERSAMFGDNEASGLGGRGDNPNDIQITTGLQRCRQDAPKPSSRLKESCTPPQLLENNPTHFPAIPLLLPSTQPP